MKSHTQSSSLNTKKTQKKVPPKKYMKLTTDNKENFRQF